MDLNALHYFCQVYRCGSFSQAAKLLYISQQGVSKAVASLEQELGASLFVRTAKGLRPTRCGKLLYERGSFILDYLEETRLQLEQLQKQEEGVLSISCLYGTSLLFGSPSVHGHWAFAERSEAQCRQDVLTGLSHGAVTISFGGEASLEVLPLARLRLCAAVSCRNPLSRQKLLTQKELCRLPLIQIEDLRESYQQLAVQMRKLYPEFQYAHSARTLVSAMELCREDKGAIVIMNRFTHVMQYQGIVMVPIEEQELTWNLTFLFPKASAHRQKLLGLYQNLLEAPEIRREQQETGGPS